MPALISGTLAGEFARYFVSGLLALGVDFALYVSLTEMANWHYLASAAVAFCAGLTTVYLLSVFWVFRVRRLARRLHEFLLFAGIGLVGLALTIGVLFVLTSIVGLDYRASKVAAVGFMFNFTCRKLLLFRHAKPISN